MGVLDPNWKPLSAPQQAEQDLNNHDLTTTIGGKQYRVIDGDTIYDIEAQQSFRLQGVNAREVAKPDFYDGGYTEGGGDSSRGDQAGGVSLGEVGGLDQRYTLWKLLDSGEFDTLENLGLQEFGAGEGKRNIARINNSETGKDLSETLYASGLIEVSDQTGSREINAKRDANLEAAFTGSNEDQDKWGYLGDWAHEQPVVFKGLALDESWYNPEFYRGVAFDDPDIVNWDEEMQRGGFTELNPLKAGWATGWSNAQADFGAAIDALGVGFDSEWLQSTGRDIKVNALNKLDQIGEIKISRLSDIADDTYLDTASNALDWLVTNSAMSLPYMAAIAAPAVALAPFTGGGSLAAGATAFAASSLPSTVLHAGAVWNSVDNENKDKVGAGKSFAAGFGMGLLDRVGFSGIKGFKPSTVLKDPDKIIKAVADRDNIPLDEAKLFVNSAAREELKDVFSYLGETAAKNYRQSGVLKANLASLAKSMGTEGLTEAGQEGIQYLTAAHINGDEVNYEELQAIMTEAAIAGAAVGGAFKATGIAANTATQRLKDFGLETFDIDTRNDYEQVYLELQEQAGGDPDGSVEDQIDNVKAIKRDKFKGGVEVEGLTNSLASESENYSKLKEALFNPETGEIDTSLGELAEVAGHYSSRLVKAPLLSYIKASDLRENDAIRWIVNRTMKMRGVGSAGKHYEGRRNALQGQFTRLFDQRRIIDDFGLGTSDKALREWSIQFRKLGSSGLFETIKKARKQGGLNNIDFESYGFNPQDAMRLYKYAEDANRLSHILFNTKLQALVKEYGADSEQATNFRKSKVKDWWWKHNSPDRSKVQANPEKFKNIVQMAIDKRLNDKGLSAEDRKAILSKTAEERVDEILNRDPNSDPFSLVGGTKWGSSTDDRRLLNLTELEITDADGTSYKPFDEFASDNVFSTYNLASEKFAKEISHLEYFGDGGSDLDVMFSMAIQGEINRGLSPDDARRKVSHLAKAVKDGVDASSSNYNVVKNPTLRKLNGYVGGYLAMVGLPLGVFASYPEFALLGLDALNFKEFQTAMAHGIRELSKGFVRTLESIPKWAYQTSTSGLRDSTALGSGGFRKSSIESVDITEQRDLLEDLGLDESPGALFQKLGVDESLPNSPRFRKVLDGFFTATGIRGITRIQRVAGLAFGFDFAFNRLKLLAKVPEGRPLTNDEGRAFSELRALGMDVDAMVEVMRRDSEFERKVRNPTTQFFRGDNLRGVQGVSTEDRQLSAQDDKVINSNMETFLQNFVNERIQNPGAFNRPLLFQDPHYSMLLVFNGFLSSFTANIVPKLWADKVGKSFRKKRPDMTIEAFTMVAALVLLGGLGQAMKDYVKYGGTPKWLTDSELTHRAFLASGILGQYERLGSLFFPLYGKQEGYGERLQGQVVGPIGFAAGNLKEGASALSEGNNNKALKNFLRLVPIVGAIPSDRYSEQYTRITGQQ